METYAHNIEQLGDSSNDRTCDARQTTHFQRPMRGLYVLDITPQSVQAEQIGLLFFTQYDWAIAHRPWVCWILSPLQELSEFIDPIR